MANSHHTIVIGGGLGGLFTGALLARCGEHVVVLEQQATAGGGLQQFERYGRTFATGMHVMGGLGPTGALRRMCHFLNIEHNFDTRPCDALCEVGLPDGTSYTLPQDATTRLAYLRQHFPDEAEGLERYEAALHDLADNVDLFNLRIRTGVSPFDFNTQLLTPADDFVSQYVHDPRLRQLLQFADILCDARPGHTPAYVHAVVSELYRRDTAMPVVGAPSLAHALIEAIHRCGGEVRTGVGVTAVECADRHITALHTSTDERLTADHFVAAIAPQRLLSLLPPGAFPPAFSRRINLMPAGTSAFKVFYDLEPEAFPFIAHPVYLYETAPRTAAAPTDAAALAPAFLDRWMYVTPPVPRQGAWAQTLEAICPMPFDEVRAWADSATGHRPAAYEAWKQRHIEAVTERIEHRHPGFSRTVRHAFAATPLTWRDWFGTPEGAMFGTLKDCTDPARTRLSVATKIDNLYLSGQNVNQHGICGTPLTALLTAEAIVGEGTIINQL